MIVVETLECEKMSESQLEFMSQVKLHFSTVKRDRPHAKKERKITRGGVLACLCVADWEMSDVIYFQHDVRLQFSLTFVNTTRYIVVIVVCAIIFQSLRCCRCCTCRQSLLILRTVNREI